MSQCSEILCFRFQVGRREGNVRLIFECFNVNIFAGLGGYSGMVGLRRAWFGGVTCCSTNYPRGQPVAS